MRAGSTPWLTPLLGGLLGAAFFLATLGPAIVRPGNLGWLMRHDTQTYLLAWHHFRREPWQWPPGKVVGVGYPVSTSVGNSDAIPLVALPLKAFHGWFPDPGQYLGAWLLACFVLQGVFGALLVRQVTADRTTQVLGAALFVQTPALLFRVGHTALCGHWLLLAAIWVAASHRQRPWRWRLTAWCLVAAGVAATQPYLAVLVLGLAAADFASDALWPRPSPAAVPDAAAGFGAVVVVMVAVFWLAGIFLVGGSDLEREGLGFYSMNLLAPIISLGTSALLPDIPAATPGQYEGMLYFGAGWLALALAAAAAALLGKGTAPSLRLGWLAVAVFWLYALSPMVTAGSTTLVDLRASTPAIFSVFRSSGRFGWLGMYVIFATVLATVARTLPRRTAIGVVAAALVLQTVDLTRMYTGVRARERSAEWTRWEDPLTHPVWNLALPHYRHLVMVPADMCVGAETENAGPHLPFSLRAGSHGVTINSGNAGRYDGGAVIAYCLAADAAIRAGQVADDSLYVLTPTMRDVLARATRTPLVCGSADGFQLCASEASAQAWIEPARAAGFAAVSALPARR
ncbi:MAG: DUF6311 domain-containing protein [Vicinamibacterales bacterium]